ncbi:hypothetical protein, partial [Luteimonas fraxinea]|uniref:hypothetical protein n=1 Tax=Luteimonas fraxinea TaxID=2901869 RepID=UPI001E642372
ARSPNSLRSDMGCSSATPGSGARLALRLSIENQELKATATATAEAQARNQQDQNDDPHYALSKKRVPHARE